MHPFLSQRRHISVILCFAIMLNLLWPALGQATVAPGLDAIAAEICSARGTVYSSPASQHQPPGPTASHHLKHCALCASLAAAPPPAPLALRAPLTATTLGPAAGYTAPTPHRSWPDARPRAPPSLA